MAEKKTEEPLSLNQRYRLPLQERSSIPPESKVKLDGRRRLCKAASSRDEDVPHFFGIDDFDSPSPGPDFGGDDRENRPTYTDKPCEEEDDGDNANHEEQSLSFLPVKKPSNVKSQGKHLSSGVDGGETKAPGAKSQADHENASKARIEGRRRLCKVGDDQDKTTNDESNFSGIFDFDSPLPKKDVLKSNNGGGGNEIRDILNELSSKMEILSIEKKRVPKVVKDSSSVLNDGKNRAKKEALSKYTAVMGDYAGQEDSDDDCVVMSNQKYFKEVDKQRRKLKQKAHDKLEIVDNDSVSVGEEEENSFTLSDPKSTYNLPTKIAKMLYPHQRDGLKWLWALHCQGKGGILGDDMGLGKTMQICGFLAGLFNSRLTKRVLIVAPKTLLPHWMKELSVVGLSRKTKEYFGTCVKAREYELQYILQNNGILLTTYDIVRNNTKSLCGDHYFRDGRGEDDIVWDYMILDEGHLIKNPSTQRAKSLLEIPSVHRIIISGTPIQNNLKELWALFNFCCPDLLGDKNWFKLKYESAILRGNDKSASDRDKRIGSAVATELRARIQPYFLRRLKSEVFGEDDASNVKLSKKNEMIVWLKLTNCQRQLYEAFLNSEIVLSAFDGSPLAALTILKKICDHPLLLTKRAAEDVLEGMDSILNPEDKGVAEKLAMHLSDVTEEIDFVEKTDVSCKISFIISLMNELIPKGHNVLIFSQTRKMLDLIQESLTSNGYKYLRIDGTTKVADRLSVVNKFQEGGGAPIFLLTSQVGGLGLTLTKADRVIVVDPAWNPSTDNQSVDRAYRIGQEKDVIVYRLMTCGTVEEKIYRKQVYKGGLFKSATEHKEQIRYFSQQDLRELLSLPKQGFDISLTQQQLHEEHDSQHTMNNYMEEHIKFLENLGIAGVSHHSLLFSKTAPVPDIPEEELARLKESMVVGGPSSHYSVERNIDCGAQNALNPKDVKLQKKIYSPNPSSQPTESEVKDRINRLSQILKNKAMVSSLPDKGEKLTKQIADLTIELEKIQLEKTSQKKIISLDDEEEDGISRQLERVLNV